MSGESWSAVLADLIAGSGLDESTALWALGQIMDGQATDAQIAGFLVGLRAKGETPDEVNGLVSAMLDHAVALDVPGPSLDVVGTGGDRSHSVNISTMAAIVCAAAGAKVVKHGNRAASSSCGSADVLAELGVIIDLRAEAVAECVATVGIGFCFAPVFHPAMRHVGGVRRELGVPTVFNILGPLANPARPSAQLVGCADLRLAPLMADVLARRGTKAVLVRGRDGLDEITVFGQTDVWDTTGPSVAHGVIDSSDFGIESPQPNALRGGDPRTNARVARELFAGERGGNLGAVRDAVALNAAAAMSAWDAAGGRAPTDADAGTLTASDRIAVKLPTCFEAIDSGAAAGLLDRWIAESSRLAG